MNSVVFALSLASVIFVANCLECDPATQTKVSVLLEDPTEFDENEQYLFAELVVYALRKHCSDPDLSQEVKDKECTSTNLDVTAEDVELTEQTTRFAMCVAVPGFGVNFIQSSINLSFSRFTGGLALSENVLEIEGVPKSLQSRPEPDFPTWLIPFLCIVGLLLLVAIIMVSYTVYQSKHPKDLKEEDESLADDYETGKDNAAMDPVTAL